ncbi:MULTISPECIES: DUF6344 domain-containing protein [unclassified Streptomyces]|uniref:DUF6344 domain-containing protein n=1 Tax=unclassified Streptomyces TaxID=2593676 RepID=UPI002256DAED|nr:MULTISPECIES: DUF6344 domain-containing protein [unclassified Streptomyces]MCX5332854.1 DUF6344 domain-containing protein [Streptomyces sp. NBC_00140]MCX5362252.1 DUF6344 domain-containing protein [Streptomyces sp. NBC_00124]
MAQNKVMNLWTAIVTALLALCTTLGLITTTATAAVPQTEPTRNSSTEATTPAQSLWPWSYTRSLPPTMKQRIRAEAHGKTPSCRNRPPADTEDADGATSPCDDSAAEPATPLQR